MLQQEDMGGVLESAIIASVHACKDFPNLVKHLAYRH